MKEKETSEYDYHYFYGDPSEPNFDSTDLLTDWATIHAILDLSPILEQIYDVACFVSFFTNLIHLLILTRKELRSNLVYIVMIGVCSCDIVQSAAKITRLVLDKSTVYTIGPCVVGQKYSHLLVESISKTIQIMSRQCSCFLVLYIAALRAFSVIYPMSNYTNNLMKPKFGILVVLVTSVVSSAWSVVYFIQINYKRVPNCVGEKRTVYVPYAVVYYEKWESKYLFIDGCISFAVSVLYVIVTVVLVIALCQNRKRQKKLGKENKSSNASSMIVAMAVSLFISEFTYGLLYLANHFIFQDYFDQAAFEQLDSFVLTLFICNSAIHALICFFMSSQYRDTVKGLFWRKKPERNLIAVVENTSSVETTSKTSASLKKSY